jgi:carboxymethylenebutenolidase
MSKTGKMVTVKPGEGYLVEGTGAGILVLHAWWGLNDFFKGFTMKLAEEGFTALALDLYHGKVAADLNAAKQLRQSFDRQAAHAEIESAVAYLRERTEKKIGVIGFSMGARLAFWVVDNCFKEVGATVAYYGTSGGRFRRAQSPVLGHFAEHDPYERAEQIAALRGRLQAQNIPIAFHVYPATQHWFAEENRPEYDPEAAQLAWKRTIEFLKENL